MSILMSIVVITDVYTNVSNGRNVNVSIPFMKGLIRGHRQIVRMGADHL